MTLLFKKNKIPVVIDTDDEDIVKKVGINWKCNALGIISHPYIYNGIDYEVKLHELIMANTQQKQNRPVLHIDKLGLDNRKINLMYDTQQKDITKNMKKKKRSIILPSNQNITPDEIPTYVWYVKPEGTHADRFIVKIGDILWKQTCSSKVSLRFKLEEAKAYLRKLKEEKPSIFHSFSMNGDFNKMGEKLLEQFYKIIYKAGFTHIKKLPLPNATDKYLAPHKLSSTENDLFSQVVLSRQLDDPKKIIKLLPKQKKITSLPEYCYYRPASAERGEFFIVKGHPKQNGIWTSSTSKQVSLEEKYKSMLNFLEKIQ